MVSSSERLRFGMLVSKASLTHAVSRRSGEGVLRHYGRAAERHGLELFVFNLGGVDLQAREARGYVWQGRAWERARAPIPPVMYRRVIPKTFGTLYLMRTVSKLIQRGLFNSVEPTDRWDEWSEMAQDALLGPHLPAAWLLTPQRCEELPDLVRSSGAIRIRSREATIYAFEARVRRHQGRRDRFVWTTGNGTPRVLGAAALVRRARATCSRCACMLVGDPTSPDRLESNETPSDMAITMWAQRGDAGRWRINGLASVESFLEPARDLLTRLCSAVADRLSARYEHIAEVAIDLVPRSDGPPALLDWRLHPHRTVRSGEQSGLFEALCDAPIAYARYLLST